MIDSVVSNSSFHGMLFFVWDFSSEKNSCFDDEEYSGDVLEDQADEGDAERPREVVVLPLGHVVTPVAESAEYDESDRAEGSCKHNDKLFMSFVNK